MLPIFIGRWAAGTIAILLLEGMPLLIACGVCLGAGVVASIVEDSTRSGRLSKMVDDYVKRYGSEPPNMSTEATRTGGVLGTLGGNYWLGGAIGATSHVAGSHPSRHHVRKIAKLERAALELLVRKIERVLVEADEGLALERVFGHDVPERRHRRILSRERLAPGLDHEGRSTTMPRSTGGRLYAPLEVGGDEAETRAPEVRMEVLRIVDGHLDAGPGAAIAARLGPKRMVVIAHHSIFRRVKREQWLRLRQNLPVGGALTGVRPRRPPHVGQAHLLAVEGDGREAR